MKREQAVLEFFGSGWFLTLNGSGQFGVARPSHPNGGGGFGNYSLPPPRNQALWEAVEVAHLETFADDPALADERSEVTRITLREGDKAHTFRIWDRDLWEYGALRRLVKLLSEEVKLCSGVEAQLF